MQYRKCLVFVIVLVATTVIDARAQQPTPVGIPGLPRMETAGLSAEEKRTFSLALAYAQKVEPQLEYRLSNFRVVARDAKTGVFTVQVYGVPMKGSKWRSASVGYKLLVHPDGKVSEPSWSLRYGW